MKEKDYGRIVNVSSGAGQLSDMNGKHVAYRLSKVSLNAITRIVADEYKASNILVNRCDTQDRDHLTSIAFVPEWSPPT